MNSSKITIGDFITKRLEDQGISLREFARRVNVSHVFVVRVKQEQARFPADQFTTWCAAMELNDEEQLKFLHIAVIAQGPPALQAYIARLESQINKLKK